MSPIGTSVAVPNDVATERYGAPGNRGQAEPSYPEKQPDESTPVDASAGNGSGGPSVAAV